MNDDDDEAANVKQPRTNSGGETALLARRLGVGLGGVKPLPVEEQDPLGSCDDCLADR